MTVGRFGCQFLERPSRRPDRQFERRESSELPTVAIFRRLLGQNIENQALGSGSLGRISRAVVFMDANQPD